MPVPEFMSMMYPFDIPFFVLSPSVFSSNVSSRFASKHPCHIEFCLIERFKIKSDFNIQHLLVQLIIRQERIRTESGVEERVVVDHGGTFNQPSTLSPDNPRQR